MNQTSSEEAAPSASITKTNKSRQCNDFLKKRLDLS